LTEFRERYGLSAIKMAQVLGLGVNQYAKYEQGEMPSESIGKMLRSIQTPAVFMGYIDSAKNQFSEAEYKKICAKVQKSFIKIIKSKPDLSWFWEFFSPRMVGKVAL
jgi:transcriptional regulator with XRE-family HTH domain